MFTYNAPCHVLYHILSTEPGTPTDADAKFFTVIIDADEISGMKMMKIKLFHIQGERY